jgi:hypothetical protein
MAYKLPPLPYDYTTLEPHIDARTMEIHHTKVGPRSAGACVTCHHEAFNALRTVLSSRVCEFTR